MMKYRNIRQYWKIDYHDKLTGAQNSLQPNGSVAMSDGGTQSSSNVISSEISEAGMEISIASKEASKQVIKGKTIFVTYFQIIHYLPKQM